jgi:hypothetical protein
MQAEPGADLEAAFDRLRGARIPYDRAHAHDLLQFVTQNRGDHAATLAHANETLVLCRGLGHTLGLAQCCQGMVSTLVAVGRLARAARALAVAEPIRQTLAAPLPPPEAIAAANASVAALT